MRTGGNLIEKPIERMAAAMEFLVFALFLSLLTLASLFGWVADSRDGADWRPTNAGRRAKRQREAT